MIKRRKISKYKRATRCCLEISKWLAILCFFMVVLLALGTVMDRMGIFSWMSQTLQRPTDAPTKVPTPIEQVVASPTPSVPPEEYFAEKYPELHTASASTTTIKLGWNYIGGVTYQVRYREANEADWVTMQTEEKNLTITGLKPATRYQVVLQYTDGEEFLDYTEPMEFLTWASGYGDPFLAVKTNLVLGDAKKTKTITSRKGCLGVRVWPQKALTIYSSPETKERIGEATAGVQMRVDADDAGHYCYLNDKGEWYVRISNGGNQIGWVQAGFLFIDLAETFQSYEQSCSLQINRTNAYSSIFKIGGSAMHVDSSSPESTRYEFLNTKMERSDLFTAVGRNSIQSITGNRLKNYGSRYQMPVIWDLALKIIICQRNAFENGCTLLIYDGYRPSSASKGMNGLVRSLGYLSQVVNGRTLANGNLGTHYTEGNYIANESKHNKGIAVDLSLIAFDDFDFLGEELTMQTAMHSLDFRSHMRFNNGNADLLKQIMTDGTNLVHLKGEQEWWHFELSPDTSVFPLYNQYQFVDFEM